MTTYVTYVVIIYFFKADTLPTKVYIISRKCIRKKTQKKVVSLMKKRPRSYKYYEF